MSPTIPRAAERVEFWLVRRASKPPLVANTREQAETMMSYGDRLLHNDLTLGALLDHGAREVPVTDVRLQGQPTSGDGREDS